MEHTGLQALEQGYAPGQKRKIRDSPCLDSAKEAFVCGFNDYVKPAGRTTELVGATHGSSSDHSGATFIKNRQQTQQELRPLFYSGTHMPVDGWFQPCRSVRVSFSQVVHCVRN